MDILLSYIYIYIYIIIMLCRQHGYPWPSLATSPYHSSPPAGLQSYILCPHIAAVCKFGLVVLLLLGLMWGSIGVHHLRARPCFSSSVLRVWFVLSEKISRILTITNTKWCILRANQRRPYSACVSEFWDNSVINKTQLSEHVLCDHHIRNDQAIRSSTSAAWLFSKSRISHVFHITLPPDRLQF